MRRRGFSLLELVVAMGLVAVLAGIGLPALAHGRRVATARAAADYLAGRFQLARTEAIKRHVHVAFRWEEADGSYRVAAYRDANGNGVRSAEIAAGIDPVWLPSERLPDRFSSVDFGIWPGTPLLDEDEAAVDADPIRVGRGRLLSFTPLGAATSGTIYVAGPDRLQLAVRVLGATGRVRVFEFNEGGRTWQRR